MRLKLQLNYQTCHLTLKFIETELPKDDMMTVDLNTLDPKPNPMPKKTMTPRHKVKRIKKNGKIQIIQSPGVHKVKFKSSHKIADSQNTPIKSPKISCDSTVPDTGTPKSDSSKWFWGSKTQNKITKQKPWRCPRGVCHKCL